MILLPDEVQAAVYEKDIKPNLTPGKALIDCAEYYLKAKDFDCHNQVMEYHIIEME